MATKLGDVSIKLVLDTTEVERELKSLEQRARQAGATRSGAPSSGPGWESIDESASTPWRSIDEGPSPRARLRDSRASWFGKKPQPRQMTQRQVARYFQMMKGKEQRQQALLNLRARAAATRVGAGGGAQLGELPSPSQLPGVRQGMTRLGLAGPRTITPATTATLGAVVYAGIRTAALAAPSVVAAGEGFAGSRSRAIEQTALQAHNAIVAFEAHVKAYTSGLEKANAMRTAVARVTGELPPIPLAARVGPFTLGATSTSAYYDFFQKADTRDKELEKAWERLKDREYAQAFGKYVRESFKKAFTK